MLSHLNNNHCKSLPTHTKPRGEVLKNYFFTYITLYGFCSLCGWNELEVLARDECSQSLHGSSMNDI